MRCKYCGSNVIHPHTEHKVFSGKKAAAGAVMFGVVGAAAGMIGNADAAALLSSAATLLSADAAANSAAATTLITTAMNLLN